MATEDFGHVRDSWDYVDEAEENELREQVRTLQQRVQHLNAVIEQNARTVKTADEVLYNQLTMVTNWNKRLDELVAENKQLKQKLYELEAGNRSS